MSDPPSTKAPEDPAEALALRRVRRFVESYTKKGPFALYPEPEVVENVVQGLASNLVAHGKMYCPCAPIEQAIAQGSALVCPCEPHEADIARQGHCDCALFASHELVASYRLRRP